MLRPYCSREEEEEEGRQRSNAVSSHEECHNQDNGALLPAIEGGQRERETESDTSATTAGSYGHNIKNVCILVD